MVNHGTRPTPKSHKRYSYHRTFGGTTTIPQEFTLDAGLTMPDQSAQGLPFACTGFTLVEICQDRDRIIYNPKFSYDKTLFMEGIGSDDAQFERVGCGIEDSLKSGIVYGVQAITETTDIEALKHRIGDYYDAIEGSGMDCFDSIRSAMWKENKSIYVGTPWLANWSNPQGGIMPQAIVTPDQSTPWHAWKICGSKLINGEMYLIGKTWQGSEWGDTGWAYFSRDTVNKVFAIDGSVAYVWVAFSGQTIQTVKLTIMETLVSFLKSLLVKKKNTGMPTQPIPVASSEPLLWDTPLNVRHSLRVMCDNAGMSVDQKNILCACVEQESRFNTQAVNHNKDAEGATTSSDWGVCQINDYFHIGEGKDFPSVEYVLENPEADIAWMIKMFQAGKQNMWSSYSSGAYKQWL